MIPNEWQKMNGGNVVDRVADSGGGYGQQAQVHFIDGTLNAQRYECRHPIVVPFIQDHHLMLQCKNVRPHVARICT